MLNIVRKVRSTEGIIEHFTFRPSQPLLKECSDLVTVNCNQSGYIDTTNNRLDMAVELHSLGFNRHIGKPTFPLRIFSDLDRRSDAIHLEFAYEMSEDEFGNILGLDAEEIGLFKSELFQDLQAICMQQQLENKNFRIREYRSGGECKRLVFRPVTMIADYLVEVGIDLYLSNFIDLENRPKMKGGKPISVFLMQEREKMEASGWDEYAIEKALDKLAVLPQFDIMLSLVYNGRKDVLPLGMYTQPNGNVKFFNGDDENLYQRDLIGTIKVPSKELQEFKDCLCNEVLDVLREMGIKHLGHSVDDLGLEEPWADEIGQIDMAKIKKLKNNKSKSNKSKNKKKVAI